ncbi:anacyclamide/piricyclamide family prenylated cyclic peptide [Hassallia byssoidea VB512170]|uniref:Anacyclamide/piricyclamide family prenylated cyclic peptide n=1 Tax=Hassallia byssoidea VB512170 TaxID=1304833 RepID=A0A846HKV3_9CYAN|nr:anacyclamide/piricyclamide family prenylated cyclic peptide [Hassalia byssoidea]NEU77074.1 anacyclamide/piricyclamide family prenylated cyclic peptide [Hassalia byssoidea VB512170]
MKKKSLLPQLAVPVVRTSSGSTNADLGVTAQTYCDIATRQCTPFAGDDAE